jgi:hypothetical protein
MRLRTLPLVVLALAISSLTSSAHADSILGTAGNFAVLAGSTVTNTGTSVIGAGNLGVWPGTAITGFPPGIVTAPGTINDGDAVASQAESDLGTAFTTLATEPVTTVLTGTDLGGLVLTPGVYYFASSAQLTGTLTLNAEGNPDAVWIFQIGSTLTTASDSSVVIENQGADADNGLFWQVGSSATLGTTTDFLGNIVALTSITLDTGATDNCGRVLAENGAVTLDDNTISTACANVSGESGSGGLSGNGSPVSTPEPGTLALLMLGLLSVGFLTLRKSRSSPPTNCAEVL